MPLLVFFIFYLLFHNFRPWDGTQINDMFQAKTSAECYLFSQPDVFVYISHASQLQVRLQSFKARRRLEEEGQRWEAEHHRGLLGILLGTECSGLWSHSKSRWTNARSTSRSSSIFICNDSPIAWASFRGKSSGNSMSTWIFKVELLIRGEG